MTYTKIKLRKEDYPEDVTRLQRVVTDQGYDCSRMDAQTLWNAYSNSLCAGWLMMDSYSDEGLWQAVEPFVEVVYE